MSNEEKILAVPTISDAKPPPSTGNTKTANFIFIASSTLKNDLMTAPFYFVPVTAENRDKCPELTGKYHQERPEAPKVWEYKTVNGTTYRKETPEKVIQALEDLLKDAQGVKWHLRTEIRRVCIEHGDTETGRAWNHPDDASQEAGYIGRSSGEIKVPILVHNARSYGGAAIMPEHIVRIRTAKGKKVLYVHPKFHYDEKPV